jgi:hypothetical protein
MGVVRLVGLRTLALEVFGRWKFCTIIGLFSREGWKGVGGGGRGEMVGFMLEREEGDDEERRMLWKAEYEYCSDSRRNIRCES